MTSSDYNGSSTTGLGCLSPCLSLGLGRGFEGGVCCLCVLSARVVAPEEVYALTSWIGDSRV